MIGPEEPSSMSWDALIQEFYHPPFGQRPARINELREEIRRRVDAVDKR